MKRRVIQVVVLLLLGAIVNVAVAWGCRKWVDTPLSVTSFPPGITHEVANGFGIEREVNINVGDIDFAMGVSIIREKSGWPLFTLIQGDMRVVVWPGFAINTIYYAAVLWMMFAMPYAFNRRMRIKRGLCPACAYPVGTSPVCTECGGAVGVD